MEYVLLALVVILLLWQLFSFTQLRRLQRFYAQLVSGTQGGNLEQVLTQRVNETRQMRQELAGLQQALLDLHDVTSHDLQYAGLRRFNPYGDTGGDQSFTLVLADGRGNGVLITSLHGRGTTRIYARTLENWSAPHLSEEDSEAIEETRARHKKETAAKP